jgi:Protein of unknown function (DUF1579)
MKLRDLSFVACGLLMAAVAGAQESKPAGHPPMSADQKAMMEAWEKASSVGEPHKRLAGMEGTWDAEVSMWMAPGQPPAKSMGTSVNKAILGGRWIEQEFTGSAMGQPFQGVGYTGYDNTKKKYVSSWIDSMSTALMVSEGTFDAAGKVMTSLSTSADPMTGKPMQTKGVMRMVDSDHHVYEMWETHGGKETKTLEIHYRRKK